MVTPYEYLRDLRNKLANRNHVEPYMILTDRMQDARADTVRLHLPEVNTKEHPRIVKSDVKGKFVIAD